MRVTDRFSSRVAMALAAFVVIATPRTAAAQSTIVLNPTAPSAVAASPANKASTASKPSSKNPLPPKLNNGS